MPSSTPESVLVVQNSEPTTMNNGYKGKAARSWHHLPGEIVRLIATFYLLDISTTVYGPKTWETREMWPQRFAFTTFRDAHEIERLMDVFPAWKPHLECHLFWNKACTLLDPHGSYNHLVMAPPTIPTAGSNAVTNAPRITMYRHYRYMVEASCVVCRVNYPYNAEGLFMGSTKRSVSIQSLGVVSVCKDHKRSTAFCGVCLREAPRADLDEDYLSGPAAGCAENDDRQTWPGVETTCRSCRSEALWRCVGTRHEWRVALNFQQWAHLDWETRQSVESFIDVGEGTIPDVLQIAEEKHWLRSYTKLADILQQALAAARFVARAEAGEEYGSEDDLSDDDVEDPELLAATEENGGIKDLALNDWARNRILDGHWISPADEWFNSFNGKHPRSALAQHPCPWNRQAVYEGALDDGQGDEAQELQHPRPKTLCPHPPSYSLCEQAYRAYQRQMREILLPPMRNIARKLMMECNDDGTDPAVRAVKMSIDDVARELRDESAWYNGIDWLERRANLRLEEERRRAKDEDESSTSSHSGGSHTTSPVLSTTTLQTTPSPPPSGKDDEPAVSSPLAGAPPPLSPVAMRPPELLRPIPFVPVITEHMPTNSRDTFEIVWREACAPIYQCCCSICTRAMMNANMPTSVPAQTQTQTQIAVPPVQQVQRPRITTDGVVIMPPRNRDEEEELDESEEEYEDGESERGDADDTSVPETLSPALIATLLPEPRLVTSRKRSCSDFELDHADSDSTSLSASADLDDRSRTPPKRVRREGSFEHSKSPSLAPAPPSSLGSTPLRQRKRSSEELEGHDDVLPASGKRHRPEVNELPSPSPMTRLLSPEAAAEKNTKTGSVEAN